MKNNNKNNNNNNNNDDDDDNNNNSFNNKANTENDAEMLAGWVVVTYFRKDLGYLCLPLYVAKVVLEPAGRSIHDRWCCIHC